MVQSIHCCSQAILGQQMYTIATISSNSINAIQTRISLARDASEPNLVGDNSPFLDCIISGRQRISTGQFECAIMSPQKIVISKKKEKSGLETRSVKRDRVSSVKCAISQGNRGVLSVNENRYVTQCFVSKYAEAERLQRTVPWRTVNGTYIAQRSTPSM